MAKHSPAESKFLEVLHRFIMMEFEGRDFMDFGSLLGELYYDLPHPALFTPREYASVFLKRVVQHGKLEELLELLEKHTVNPEAYKELTGDEAMERLLAAKRFLEEAPTPRLLLKHHKYEQLREIVAKFEAVKELFASTTADITDVRKLTLALEQLLLKCMMPNELKRLCLAVDYELENALHNSLVRNIPWNAGLSQVDLTQRCVEVVLEMKMTEALLTALWFERSAYQDDIAEVRALHEKCEHLL